MRPLIAIIATALFLTWGGVRIYHSVTFNIAVTGHLKRAADANTVELASKEMETAVAALEAHGLTSGYTSILYRTPSEDIGFWYTNLKGALGELQTVSPQATQLEKSNVLMKLRETILDSGEKGSTVTAPGGISVYPSNAVMAFWGFGSFLWLCLAVWAWAREVEERANRRWR